MTDCNYGTPLANRDLENRATQFDKDFVGAFNNNSWTAGLVETKLVAQRFIEETQKLDHDDRYKVFSRVQELNDKEVCLSTPPYLPMINIVFGNLDKDKNTEGKRQDLIQFQMTSGIGSFRSTRELYHP